MRLLGLSLSVVVVVGGALAGCGKDDPKIISYETVLDTSPAALTNSAQATFTFHSDPGGAQFVCQVDAQQPVGCGSPFMANVADGMHTFAVVTLSSRGMVDPTPATATWSVDTVPPETTLSVTPPAVDNSLAPVFQFTGADPTTGAFAAGAVTFQCSLDGAAFATCASPMTVPVVDGDHTFAVRAVDTATNVDPSPASFTWTVDSTTPDTRILTGPADGSTTGPNATFTFDSPDLAATFECSLDAAAFAPCSSPLALGPSQLTDGSHTLIVRAKDIHGVVDPSPGQRTWTVDATPPTVTITSTPPNPSNLATPAFGFSSPDTTATFECQVDGVVTFAACTSAWMTPTLAAGAHTFRVRPTDPYGNVGAEATYAWTIDLTAPTVAITGGPIDPTPTKLASPQFTFTASDGTVTCTVDGTATTPCTSPFTPSALPDGSHTLTVSAVDTAGNVGTATRPFTTDTMPPVVTITSGPIDPTPARTKTPQFAFTISEGTATCKVDGGAAGACTSPFTTASLAEGSHTLVVVATDAAGNVGSASRAFSVDTIAPTVTINAIATPTTDNTPTITFSASDGTLACTMDGAAVTPCTSPLTSAMLADGSHTFAVTATDTAGNTGSASRTFVVDTTKPTVAITSGPIDPTPTKFRVSAFGFTVSDGTVTCTLDGTATTPCTSPFTTASLADGPHTLVVSATDTAGNTGTASRAFTVDATVPVVTVALAPPATSPTNDNTPTFNITSTEGTLTCTMDGAALPCTPPQVTSGTLADGSHTIALSSVDAAGNIGTASLTFVVDATPPVVTITGGPTPANSRNPQFTFTVSGATSTTCTLTGASIATRTTTSCTSPYTVPGAALADGGYVLTVSASDAAGNPASAMLAFTVDATAPVVTVALSGTTSPTMDNTPTFNVTTTEGTVTCTMDGVAIACAVPSFTSAALSDNTHTLVVTATDAAGNTGTASLVFVVDTTPPLVAITGGPTPPNSRNPQFTFTVTGATSTTCTLTAAAFTTRTTTPCTSPYTVPGVALLDGPYTLTVSATDAAGNPASAARAFTVDGTPPTLTVALHGTTSPTNDNTPTFDISTTEGTIACTMDGTAIACTTPTVTSAPLTDGSHTIVVSATDAAGNPGSASLTFVVDTTRPVVTITGGPTPANSRNPQFTFVVAGGATSVSCTLTSTLGGFLPRITMPCTSPYTVPGLALLDGPYTLTVDATDAATNSGSAASAFTVDGTAPVITISGPSTTSPVTSVNPSLTFSFTVTDLPNPSFTGTISCTIDGNPVTPCAPPSVTLPTQTEGSHTLVIHASDSANNPATATQVFLVDTVGPAFAITDAPPASWPVDYYTVTWALTTAEAGVTYSCTLNGSPLGACTSPLNLTGIPYGSNQLAITGKDQWGNATTQTASWTSSTGLVLHYPWEQGKLANTSPLNQRTAYSPDGNGTVGAIVGGWAGTAQTASSVQIYKGVQPALSSSPDGSYAASFWLRLSANASGTVWSTMDPTLGGISVSVSATSFGITVSDGVNSQKMTAIRLPTLQWNNLAIRTDGPSKTTSLFVNGQFVQSVSLASGATGWGANMAKDLVVGSYTGAMDIDDLRFYNSNLSDVAVCTTLARGVYSAAANSCAAGAPVIEFDYESNLNDTGTWHLPLELSPTTVVYTALAKLGLGASLSNQTGYIVAQYGAHVSTVPSHSMSFWYAVNGATYTIFNDVTSCGATGGVFCGLRVTENAGKLLVEAFKASDAPTSSATISAVSGVHSIVITEQKSGGNTKSLTVFLDGKRAGIASFDASYDVFATGAANFQMMHEQSAFVDEFELWGMDLGSDKEMLCENGFDGTYDTVTGACSLTSN